MTEVTAIAADARMKISGEVELILTLQGSEKATAAKICEEASKGLLSVKIGRKTKKRSLDANAYLWVLLDKIAEKIGSTKEEVYVLMVEQVGRFEMIPIRDDAAESWKRIWESRGLGWISKKSHKSRQIEGYVVTINYFGSSVYDTAEMARLIDFVVETCKDLEIETMPENEIERLKAAWQINGAGKKVSGS